MQTSQVDRRAAAPVVHIDSPYADPSHVVRQGMVIQANLGTRSAVEFLKRHGVHGAVIHRVLMGEQVRGSDPLRSSDELRQGGREAVDDPRR